MKVFTGLVYRAKRGHIYRSHTKRDRRYNCYSPCMSGDYCIVDCYVCDELFNVHPDFNCYGVPIDTDILGPVVSKID
jgi:hypothetical protein